MSKGDLKHFKYHQQKTSPHSEYYTVLIIHPLPVTIKIDFFVNNE